MSVSESRVVLTQHRMGDRDRVMVHSIQRLGQPTPTTTQAAVDSAAILVVPTFMRSQALDTVWMAAIRTKLPSHHRNGSNSSRLNAGKLCEPVSRRSIRSSSCRDARWQCTRLAHRVA